MRLMISSNFIINRYSLLGSSGCGKTTLLSCIVGIRTVESGEILIYGAKPGTAESGVPGKRVGFMPQVLFYYWNTTFIKVTQIGTLQ